MNPKKLAAAATALTLIGGGSAVAADQQIDPYIEKGATYEVQIEGETVEIAKARPEVKLNRWGGEEVLTVKKSGAYGQAKRGWFSRQQRWDKGNESVIVEPLKKGEGIAQADTGGEEGFKIDILLDAKPNTNVFTLEMEGWEDLDFWYQPPLTQDQIDQGQTRPENVIGSYAVYHKTKRNHIEGQQNYYVGKLFHIYRPKVLDANSNWVWGELGYASGMLSVTVPQDFLDSATYPVRVDPTFGYTTAGASQVNIANVTSDTSNRWGIAASSTENGNISQIDAYLGASSGTQNVDVTAVVNLEKSGGASTHGETVRAPRSAIAFTTTPSWQTFTPTSSPAIVVDDYIINIAGDGNDLSAGTITLNHDTTGSRNEYFEQFFGASSYDTVMESPWTEAATAGATTLLSIYVTYTTSGGAVWPRVIIFE